MHDLRALREDPAAFDAALARRGLAMQSAPLIEADRALRALQQRLQDMQSKRNDAAKRIGQAKARKDEATAQSLILEIEGMKGDLQAGEEEERRLAAKLREALSALPNLPDAAVPDGMDESDNREIRKHGAPRNFAADPKDHVALGEALGLMDFEAAARVSGARFVYLKGALARLERALGAFMLDLHTQEFGYEEFSAPILVRDEAMFGTAQLPKFQLDQFPTQLRLGDIPFEKGEEIFEDELHFRDLTPSEERLLQIANSKGIDPIVVIRGKTGQPKCYRFNERYWLIPTAEVSLTNYVREQILDESALPLRFTALTPCFRAEAGSAGRDTRGMIRMHQFNKVELVSITTPEQSEAEHERMTACAEEVLKRLGLPFRTMLLCAGDMGFAAAKTYDIEVWLPGQGAYREISSCSNCRDFQARRMDARYRPDGQKGTRFVHTLNGSGLAVGRALVALLETYQEADGAIAIPEILLPYMGGITRIEAAR